MDTYILFDTNVFLHYLDFDQIKWSDIIGTDPKIIVIPPVTVRELNTQKDSDKYSKKIRNRAGKTLIKLHNYFAADLQPKIDEGLELYFEDRDSLIDFPSNQLNREVNDDHLIATILMYRNEKPGSQFILVTSDYGLTLMAKARRHGIQTLKLDDSLRIKEEPDPDQEKLKEVQKELDEIKRTIPALSLCFEDSNQHVKFTLKKPLELSDSEIEAKVTELKNKFPKIPEKPQDATPKKPISAAGMAALSSQMLTDVMGGVSSEDITKYNAALDTYFEKYPEYLKSQVQFENQARKTIQLDIFLDNGGTAPGEDIDIFMHFPDGFNLVDELSEAPQEPVLPERPKTQLEKMMEMRSFSGFRLDPHIPYISNLPHTPPNVSSPNIKRTHSYDVNIHVDYIKHGLQEQIDPLFVIFDSNENASSFHIEYRILAANVPYEISGKLHVVIQKET